MDASCARQLARVVVPVLLAVAPALVVAPQAQALQSNTVTVTVTGPGTVTAAPGTTGSDGINCTQGGSSANCSESYPPDCEFDGGHVVCEPADVTLSATTPTGFGRDWGGACDGETSATCSFTVQGDTAVSASFRDNQPPSVALSSPSPGFVHGAIFITAGASDNVGINHVAFSVRGVNIGSDSSAPYDLGYATNAIADGPAAITATAFDSAGNASSSSVTVTIDNTPPDISLTGPNGDSFGPASTQTWGIAATDAGSGLWTVKCSVVPSGHPASFGNCSGGNTSHAVSNEPEGSYVFTVRATDVEGNVRDITRPFSIDATPPDTTITSGPEDGSSQTAGSATFGFASEDSGASFACRVYAAGTTPPAFAACSDASSDSISGLGIGTYRFDVEAIDAAGNADPSPATRSFSVVAPDSGPTNPSTPITPTLPAPAVAPDTVIAVHPKSATKKKRASFAFSSNDAGANFECSLDGAAFTACASPFKVKVKPGRHSLQVRAVTVAGGADQTPAEWKWKVRKHKHHH